MGYGNPERKGGSAGRRRGMALALVVSVMFILLTLGTGTLFWGLQSRLRAVRDAEQIEAKMAADAGLSKAVILMRNYESGTLPSATNEVVAGAATVCSFSVEPNPDGTYTITSTGTSATATRIVYGRVRRGSTFWCGATVMGTVTMTSSSQIMPLTADDSLRVYTNSTAPGSISLKSSSIVDGDVTVGVGGDPATVISADGQSEISGSQAPAHAPLVFPPVVAPVGLPDQGNTQISKSEVISSSRQYGNLLVNGGGTVVEIDGDITLYVAGTMTIRNSAQILVRDGSRLTLYLGGNLTFDRGSLQEVNLRSERIHIYGLPTCTKIDCANSLDIYVAIYAPAADCTLNSSSRVVGAIASKSLTLSSSSTLCYTETVSESCPYGSYTYWLDRWWED
jgi:hypothetical protein